MGLDMHMVQPPESTPPGYEAQYGGQPEYFRVNSGAVKLFLSLLSATAVLVEEKLPEFPERPPPGLTLEKLEALEDQDSAGGGPKPPPLTAAQKSAWSAYKAKLDKALSTRSRVPGKVPGFKLETSDGWLVTPDECRLLAQAIRAFVPKLKQEQWDKILQPFEEERKEKIAYYKAKQGFVPGGMDGPPMSLKEARDWLGQFAAYNELAARHGGFHVR